ncbi:MAG: ComF family protein [Elusimicrobia bacterium]|nr:ComF family protein [Elusimicrobiota bacterium]
MDLYRVKEAILHFCLPSLCFCCSNDLPFGYKGPLCPHCLRELFYIRSPYCKRCGVYLKNGGEVCHTCRNKKYNFDFSRSVFMYNDEISSVISAYKYKKMDWLSDWFSIEMVKKFKDYTEFTGYDSLIYIPISARKIRKRGFNQTYLIAKKLSAMLGIELIESAVIKKKDARNQVGLDAHERAFNIKDSFELVDHSRINGRNIIIIDDVATTMSTIDEMAGILKSGGAKKVSAYTIARE